MVIQDNDAEISETEQQIKPFNKKKILIYVLPAVIAIGLVVSFIIVFSKKDTSAYNGEYNVVSTTSGENEQKITVFYSLPELSASLRSSNNISTTVKLKISIELSSLEDIKTIEGMLPRINDTLLAHIVELTPDEISGANGLYNLKRELLYRINLLTDPIKVSNLNFKTFDIQKNTEEN